MSIQAITVLRGMLSMSGLAGAGMVVMGTGIIPVDADLQGVAQVFVKDWIPLRLFLTVLGAFKVANVLSLWKLGPFPYEWSVWLSAIPAICAIYGHAQADGVAAAIPPTIYTGMCVAYYLLDRSSKPSEEPKSK